MIGWWWWFNVKFYYLSYILGWKEGARIESSNISWYWRIVSSSWRFIPPFTFGSCSYLWKSLLPLNKNYWLFLICCVWCIVVYWCNSYTTVHFSLDIIEWFKYKLKKGFKLYLILIHPPSQYQQNEMPRNIHCFHTHIYFNIIIFNTIFILYNPTTNHSITFSFVFI